MVPVAPWHFILAVLAGWVHREQLKAIEYLKAENHALREKLGNKRLRFTDEQRRRLAVKGHALGRKALRELDPIVTPDTILRWYRELVAKKYDGSQQRKPGRPRTPDELRDLVSRMARENPGWGYTRIRDALGNLGYELARTTISAILKEQGIEPAPERSKRTSWQAFLCAHWDAIAACDFFTVEVLTWTGMTRFYVMFVIALQTRRIEVAGIVRQPHGAWMLQVARNLLDAEDGFLVGMRYLLMDRDPLYTTAFRELLRSAGVTPIRLPPSSPNLNAYAERFVRSITDEVTYDDLVHEVEHATERIGRLDKAIDDVLERAPTEQQEVVAALATLRGVGRLTAVTLVTEIGSFSRFESAGALMSYCGVVPSEHSSGGPGKAHRGRITKAGNAHLRRIRGEASWHYAKRPRPSAALKRRQQGASPALLEISRKAEHRLHGRFVRLEFKGKARPKIAVAVARELLGFVWHIGVTIGQQHRERQQDLRQRRVAA